MMMLSISIFILLITKFQGNEGLIGYDCGARHLNVTTLSLKDVGECEIPYIQPNVTKQYVQLLQINEYSSTRVIQCKIEIHRTVYYCGAFSHISLVTNGQNEYIYDVSREACETLHKYGTFQLPNFKILHGVKVNATIVYPVLLAGYLNSDGKCNGEGYSDPYGTWGSVVVQGKIKVTLTQYEAQVKLDNNLINLRSGTLCSLSEGHCIDLEGGYTFWNSIPTDLCNFHKYGLLYKGLANKMTNIDLNGNKQTVYSLETQGITFALTTKGYKSVCGYELIVTEHPKLVIFETQKGITFASNNKISVMNLDIFAYVNSKFVYVEKHVREQMKNLYHDVLVQRCNLERQTIKNSLSIAKQSPDDFAFDLMKGPGYMGVSAGEVVHIVKCVPVDVRIKHGQYCYAELEVTRNNKTFFLTPRTHILKQKGTRLPCNSLLPSYYFIGEAWYKILPTPVEAIPPAIIKPMTKPTWTYINPADLANNGIYNEHDLDQLRERIMFPIERPGLLNDIAREVRGHTLDNEDSTLTKLLNENAVERIINNSWRNLWSRFLTFGSASAGFIAILLVLQILRSLINIIVHGYTLHTVYGWSIRLLGAFFGSITHLLVHLSTYRQEEKATELNEIKIDEHTPMSTGDSSKSPTDPKLFPNPNKPESNTLVQNSYLSLNT